MTELVRVHLKLEPHQAQKLHKGHAVQLRHEQLGIEGAHHLMLHMTKAKKLHSAHRRKKGVRIQLSEPEISATMEGEGFGDFLNKIKSGAQWLKKNIIDSGAYQSIAKPIARRIVDTGLAAATPFLGPVGSDLARQAVNVIGEKTNAYGLQKRKHMTRTTMQHEPVHEDAMTQFYMDSMMAPRPGGPAGFTALPSTSYGDGVSSHHMYHSYYYPSKGHRAFANQRAMSGRSFRLA